MNRERSHPDLSPQREEEVLRELHTEEHAASVIGPRDPEQERDEILEKHGEVALQSHFPPTVAHPIRTTRVYPDPREATRPNEEEE